MSDEQRDFQKEAVAAIATCYNLIMDASLTLRGSQVESANANVKSLKVLVEGVEDGRVSITLNLPPAPEEAFDIVEVTDETE